MSKRSRCGQHLLSFFRVVQFILSLFALGCGIYITYTMYNMASSAHAIKEAIIGLNPDDDGVQLLQGLLVPVLRHLEGKPTRAIIITVVALWSTLLIVYLFFTHRYAKRARRDLKRNSRTSRISLSILTLLLWITAMICSILLVIEYGAFAISIGPECRTAVVVARGVIETALSAASETISDILNIINSVITIGALAIVMVAASVICGTVELVSCFVACCVSGKADTQQVTQLPFTAMDKAPVQIVTMPVSSH